MVQQAQQQAPRAALCGLYTTSFSFIIFIYIYNHFTSTFRLRGIYVARINHLCGSAYFHLAGVHTIAVLLLLLHDYCANNEQ